MTPTPPPTHPTPPHGSASGLNQPPHMPPPAIYVMPPKGPGVIRSFFGSIGRMLMMLITLFIIVAVIGGIFAAMAKISDDPMVTVYRDGASSQQVAILDLSDVIDSHTAEYIRGAVNYILDHSEYKVVVFRIDSPGGGVTASDQIWYDITRLQNAGIKIIASYGSVSASGGVYVSCGSDYIFAEPTTITGSIGVIASVLTFGELLEKVGIEPVTLVAEGSPSKDVANDVYRQWTQEDKDKIQKILDASYSTFFDRVYEGRKHVLGEDKEVLRPIADGSIYTADEALKLKLVDEIGYLDAAIDHAISMAGVVKGAQVVRIEDWGRGVQLPFGIQLSTRQSQISNESLDPEAVRLWLHEVGRPTVMYLMP